MKSKISKIFLPFFPENDELEKHWWHKIAKLIIIVTSFCSIYSLIWLTALFYFLPPSVFASDLGQLIYHSSWIPAYLPIHFAQFWSQFGLYSTLFHAFLSVPILGPLLLVYFIIAIFYLIPPFIYRVILYIANSLND